MFGRLRNLPLTFVGAIVISLARETAHPAPAVSTGAPAEAA
jgi:hypothetical protein